MRVDILAALRAIEVKAMQALHDNKLENVCDGAYVLNPDFTPNYSVMVLELPDLFGFELRVVASMVARENVHYADEAVDGAVYRALRKLMVGMREQAQTWLDAHPEKET